MNEYEKKLLSNIDRYGCSVTSVFDPDGNNPPFTYSIGIAQSSNAPELIVVGLESDVSHFLVNEYNRRVKAGERFAPRTPYDGFLEGVAVQFGEVANAHRKEYMRSACWLHDGSGFEALQLIWPTDANEWPWDHDASEWLRHQQPLLSESEC